MRRKTPVSQQVYDLLYPSGPKSETEPPNFSTLARNHLLKETRHEAKVYYGELDSIHLCAPGLDYSYPPHRRRLSRMRHHRRLFEAIDRLGLTPSEVYQLCNWEGTLLQKDEFLKKHPEQRRALEDDTGADIPTWDEVQRQRAEAAEEREQRHGMKAVVEALLLKTQEEATVQPAVGTERAMRAVAASEGEGDANREELEDDDEQSEDEDDVDECQTWEEREERMRPLLNQPWPPSALDELTVPQSTRSQCTPEPRRRKHL